MALLRFIPVATACAIAVTAFTAAAQSIDIRCETRATRSKASVRGHGLAQASYNAVLVSGGNHAQSIYQPAQDGEVVFIFDSDFNDVATPIPSNFIVHDKVKAAILDVNGDIVVGGSATCRRK